MHSRWLVVSVLLCVAAPCGAQEWPSRLGPFEMATEDGAHRLGLSFSGQLMGVVTGADVGGPDEEADGTVLFRRLRVALRGSMLEGLLATTLQLNVAPGALELMDAHLEVRFDPQLALRLGQLTTPYTRYRQQSFRAAALADWPIVTRFFGAERQIGLMAHNTATASNEWIYAAGVFTGENARASHGIGASIAYAERPPNPSDLTQPRFPLSIHPELFARVAHQHPEVRPETGSDADGGPPRHHVGLSLAWDAQPERARDLAARFALEGLLKVERFSVLAIGYVAYIEVADGSLRPGLVGGLLEASYRFDRHWEIAARYAGVARTRDLREDAAAWARDRIAEAPDAEARARAEARYADVGTTGADGELGIGVNVYVIGESLKVQLDATWVRVERARGARDDLLARLMVQLAF